MAHVAIFREQITETWSDVGNCKKSQSAEDNEKQMVGVYKTGYLNKALEKKQVHKKTENIKKKETPGPHGCKPEVRQKRVK